MDVVSAPSQIVSATLSSLFCLKLSFVFADGSFGFSASEASCSFASFGTSSSTNCVSNVLLVSHFYPRKSFVQGNLNPFIPCWRTFASFAWKNADASTISKQEIGNQVYLAVWTESDFATC